MGISWEDSRHWFTPEIVESSIRAAFLVVIVLPIALFASSRVRRWVGKKFSPHRGLIAGRTVRYGAISLIVLLVFRELGFNLSPLLGAAGIVGIALGFASQTSVSNIISGLFLIAENPFSIGDVIKIGETTGVVLSIDTLSIKLRTFNNQFVRIPNEDVIKSEVTNITKYPIRRIDIEMGVSYSSDLGAVKEVLFEAAKANPLCLIEPRPSFVSRDFGESSINFLFGVWATREQYLEAMNSIKVDIKAAFDEAGIEIPFPQRVVTMVSSGDEPVSIDEEL